MGLESERKGNFFDDVVAWQHSKIWRCSKIMLSRQLTHFARALDLCVHVMFSLRKINTKLTPRLHNVHKGGTLANGQVVNSWFHSILPAAMLQAGSEAFGAMVHGPKAHNTQSV